MLAVRCRTLPAEPAHHCRQNTAVTVPGPLDTTGRGWGQRTRGQRDPGTHWPRLRRRRTKYRAPVVAVVRLPLLPAAAVAAHHGLSPAVL